MMRHRHFTENYRRGEEPTLNEKNTLNRVFKISNREDTHNGIICTKKYFLVF